MISLYDLCVPSYLQILGATANVLDKGKTHFADEGRDLSEIMEARLYDDMLPFPFQVVCTCHQSIGAIKGAEAGVFSTPGKWDDKSYEDLQALVGETVREIEALSADAVNALEDGDMIFEVGEFKLPFTVPNFITSFSLPNFYFHATTTYDMLRMKGVPVGKQDFLGQMRMKT